MAKGLRKILKKKKVKELFNKLLKDTNILNIYTKKIKKRGIISTSITFII